MREVDDRLALGNCGLQIITNVDLRGNLKFRSPSAQETGLTHAALRH
jgi:hypothetical protein